MKLSLLPQSYLPSRRGRPPCTSSEPPVSERPSILWSVLHFLCCLFSLILGFRFSRIVFFLLFSTTTTTTTILTSTTTTITTTLTSTTTTTTLSLPILPTSSPNSTRSRVSVGRHGIRIRPWPHPDPLQTLRAHRILDAVQAQQRSLYGPKNPTKKPFIVVTPTHVRALQALHLTSLSHSLMLLPYPLTWLVVEAGGASNDTASILLKFNLNFVHIGFPQSPIPRDSAGRHRMESLMRLHALRIVRQQRMDGIIIFADDSNIHSLELFDEAQKVEFIGALSVGILTVSQKTDQENSLLPIQGPACNSSGQLLGWHTFNPLPYSEESATHVGDRPPTVLPTMLEWAGVVVNARVLWEEFEGRPDWVRDLGDVGGDGEEEMDVGPLSLVKDASAVEPLGSCGKKVLLWWLRAEARADSKILPGYV